MSTVGKKRKKSQTNPTSKNFIKRPKTKTFTGCWTCREKHRKCDLRKPYCYVCEKNGSECLGFTIRLCWDHSKSDNLRRTVTYYHEQSSYMNKTNEHLDFILLNIDELNSRNMNILPFSIFKLNLDYSENDLIQIWMNQMFPKFYMPLDNTLIKEVYLDFIKLKFIEIHNEQELKGTNFLLKQSIVASAMLWLSNHETLDFKLAYEKLNSTVQQFHLFYHLPSNYYELCTLLTAICNCMFLLTLYFNKLPPLHNVKSYIKIGTRVLNELNAHMDREARVNNVVANQSKVLNHLIRHFILLGYIIDNTIHLPVDLIKSYNAESNLGESTFYLNSYCFNFMEELVLTAHKNKMVKQESKINYSLSVKMSIFKLEDILLRKERRLFLPQSSNIPSENITFHQSSLFYIAIYLFFLVKCFPSNSTVVSKKTLVEWAREHIKQIKTYFEINNYSSGCLWSIYVIGIEATVKVDQDMVLDFLKFLSKFNLEQPEILISVLKKVWQQNSNRNCNNDPYNNLITHSIGFLL